MAPLGVANKENLPDSYSFSTSARYTGAALALPIPPQETFPYTPPQIAAIAGDFEGISPNLKAAVRHTFLNASFAREIPGGMTIEVGYAGRLSHRPPYGRGCLYSARVFQRSEVWSHLGTKRSQGAAQCLIPA